MEKRNVAETGRTPCRKDDGGNCDCPVCSSTQVKKASDKPTSIHDIDGLARLHK